MSWIPFIGSSCSGHHYGEEQFTGKIEIESDYYWGNIVVKEVRKKCQHQGCMKSKTYKRTLPTSRNEEVNLNKGELLNLIEHELREKRDEQ